MEFICGMFFGIGVGIITLLAIAAIYNNNKN